MTTKLAASTLTLLVSLGVTLAPSRGHAEPMRYLTLKQAKHELRFELKKYPASRKTLLVSNRKAADAVWVAAGVGLFSGAAVADVVHIATATPNSFGDGVHGLLVGIGSMVGVSYGRSLLNVYRKERLKGLAKALAVAHDNGFTPTAAQATEWRNAGLFNALGIPDGAITPQ